MSEHHNLLTTKEAAAYLRLSHRTLERYRVTGEGPTFLKARRRVFYRQADLDQWLENSRRRSTSDPGPEPDREATLGSIASARWLAPKRLDRDLWCLRVHLDGRPASAYAGVIADAHEQARWRDAEAVVALLRRRVRERAGEATRH